MKQSPSIGKLFVCVVVITASCHASALAQNLTGRRPDEKGQGVGKIPDPSAPVKVKIEAVGGQQLWRGDIMQSPMLPAPEVVRLWIWNFADSLALFLRTPASQILRKSRCVA